MDRCKLIEWELDLLSWAGNIPIVLMLVSETEIRSIWKIIILVVDMFLG